MEITDVLLNYTRGVSACAFNRLIALTKLLLYFRSSRPGRPTGLAAQYCRLSIERIPVSSEHSGGQRKTNQNEIDVTCSIVHEHFLLHRATAVSAGILFERRPSKDPSLQAHRTDAAHHSDSNDKIRTMCAQFFHIIRNKIRKRNYDLLVLGM